MNTYEDDYPDRQCCRDACIVIYARNMVTYHCYDGTRQMWQDVIAKGYLRHNESCSMFGVLT